MIVHLTLGSTHIPLVIRADEGLHLSISVCRDQGRVAEAVTPDAPNRRLPLLSLAGVGLICGFAGYQIAPRSEAAFLRKEASVDHFRTLADPRTDQATIPAQLERQLAERPVITPPTSTGSSPSKSGTVNAFGLE